MNVSFYREKKSQVVDELISLSLLLVGLIGVKNIILAASKDGKMTPWKSFLVGAVSKTLATVVTFPYILSKIRLQAKNTRYTDAFDVLSQIAREKGISGWYQGMQAQITKAVLAQALLFYFRGEKIKMKRDSLMSDSLSL